MVVGMLGTVAGPAIVLAHQRWSVVTCRCRQASSVMANRG
jgi:hypothetical protein